MAVAAIFGRIPLVMMEQNVRPGILQPDAVAFHAAKFASVSTNRRRHSPPTRSRSPVIQCASVYPQPRKPTEPLQILVLGGSSGAHRLNFGVLNAFKISRDFVIKLAIVHQTGEADVGLVADGYRDLGREARVVAFIDDIAAALDAADLVIARSGAMTVSEIALAGRAAIFVPYPFHSDRQQELNARVIERRGGARIVNGR